MEFDFIKYQDQIIGTLINECHDVELAKDLSQDTYIKAYRYIQEGKYKEDGKMFGWLLFIAKNLLKDHYRKIRTQREITISNDSYLFTNLIEQEFIEDEIVNEKNYKRMGKAIRNLPQHQKFVIENTVYKGIKFIDLAETSGVSLTALLARKHQAVKRLKTELL